MTTIITKRCKNGKITMQEVDEIRLWCNGDYFVNDNREKEILEFKIDVPNNNERSALVSRLNIINKEDGEEETWE